MRLIISQPNSKPTKEHKDVIEALAKPKQNPIIVIESKKSEPKSINFLALIKNFWQPKLVEFKNE
jgi:hypothetical protein